MQPSVPSSLRQEYKYFISPSVYPHLMQDLESFTVQDEHSRKAGGFYKVSSVYFETPGLKSYFDKIEGQAHRVKMRIRYYPSGLSGAGHLEFKHKNFDQNHKKKVLVTPDVLTSILRGDSPADGAFGEPLLREFLALKRANHLFPFIRVDYKRKALFARNNKAVRFTFDHGIICSRFFNFPMMAEPHIPVLPVGTILLEVKTPGVFPFWLTHLIKKYSLKRSAISKYALGVQALAVNSALSVR